MDDGQDGDGQWRISQGPNTRIGADGGLQLGGLGIGRIRCRINGPAPASDQGVNLFRLQRAHVEATELLGQHGLSFVGCHPRGDQVIVGGISAGQFMDGVAHNASLLGISHLIQAIGHDHAAPLPHQPLEKVIGRLEGGEVFIDAGVDKAQHGPRTGVHGASLAPAEAGEVAQGEEDGHR